MSLENRLVPRLQQIRKAGFTPAWELHHEASRTRADFDVCFLQLLFFLSPEVRGRTINIHILVCFSNDFLLRVFVFGTA